MSCKLHHWAFTPNVYGGRSAVRPGRESAVGDRTIRLPWLRRLLLETESRVLTDTGVYQHHHRIRSFRRQQPTSTATSKPVSIYFRDTDRAAVAGFWHPHVQWTPHHRQLETESRVLTMTRAFTSIITGFAAFVDSSPHPPPAQSRYRYISEISIVQL